MLGSFFPLSQLHTVLWLTSMALASLLCVSPSDFNNSFMRSIINIFILDIICPWTYNINIIALGQVLEGLYMKNISTNDLKKLEKVPILQVILLLVECLIGLAGAICGVFYMVEEQSIVLGLCLLMGSVVGAIVSVVLTKIVFMMYDNQIAAFYEIQAMYQQLLSSNKTEEEK